MKACVDKDLCIGCGLCASIASEIFFLDDDGKASAVKDEIADGQIDEAEDAASSCPVAAISLE
ncbi:MAG: ferredoxin [Clostridiales bacterium]|uniref:ferredoxin n=1 Tax=Clostridium sp. N3C TaxID=1776758 RepID=UPI00092DF1A7|nr:ferredoxin [Clostridium sp. N3C]NLZ49153.1 ferredoxin [Clostridiales bacterium]SCN22784.1 Ferredoxin [Clostridium sp. N3C]